LEPRPIAQPPGNDTVASAPGHQRPQHQIDARIVFTIRTARPSPSDGAAAPATRFLLANRGAQCRSNLRIVATSCKQGTLEITHSSAEQRRGQSVGPRFRAADQHLPPPPALNDDASIRWSSARGAKTSVITRGIR
jgi:hypothetical protein